MLRRWCKTTSADWASVQQTLRDAAISVERRIRENGSEGEKHQTTKGNRINNTQTSQDWYKDFQQWWNASTCTAALKFFFLLERFSIMNIKNAAMFYQNIPKMPKKKKKKKKVVAIKISARTTTSQQFRIPLWNVCGTGALLATTTVRTVPLYFKSGLEELNCWPLHDHQKISSKAAVGCCTSYYSRDYHHQHRQHQQHQPLISNTFTTDIINTTIINSATLTHVQSIQMKCCCTYLATKLKPVR